MKLRVVVFAAVLWSAMGLGSSLAVPLNMSVSGNVVTLTLPEAITYELNQSFTTLRLVFLFDNSGVTIDPSDSPITFSDLDRHEPCG